MITIELSSEEKNILRQLVENYISDLSMEISHTDRKDYRETLKMRRNVLQKLLTALEEAAKVEG